MEIICKIDCGIQVTIYGFSTGGADIDTVVQLQIFFEIATIGTGLRAGIKSVRNDDLNTVFLTFINYKSFGGETHRTLHDGFTI